MMAGTNPTGYIWKASDFIAGVYCAQRGNHGVCSFLINI